MFLKSSQILTREGSNDLVGLITCLKKYTFVKESPLWFWPCLSHTFAAYFYFLFILFILFIMVHQVMQIMHAIMPDPAKL